MGALDRVPVEALAVIGARDMTLGAVLALARDTVLPLDADGGVRLEVDGIAVAAGALLVEDGRARVRVGA